MIKVLFVCLGNICRSPMAEFVFKDIVNKKGLSNQFFIDSSATSRENEVDPWYYGNFDSTYYDIEYGCEKFLEYLLKNNEI